MNRSDERASSEPAARQNNELEHLDVPPLLEKIVDDQQSVIGKYADWFVGSPSIGAVIRYELLTSLLQAFPGGLGIYLRGKLYRLLFRRCGNGVYIGRNVSVRVPGRIELGNNIVIDDNAVIDAKGEASRSFIRCGNQVEISRNAILSCKGGGSITLGNFVTVGRNALLSAVGTLQVGSNCSIGPYATVLASGHGWSDPETSILLQNHQAKGIVIGENVWVGAHSTIMDGVTVGKNSIIGVGSIVTEDVPAYRIVAGSPARVVVSRTPVPEEATQRRGGEPTAVSGATSHHKSAEKGAAESSGDSRVIDVLFAVVDELNQLRPTAQHIPKSEDTLLFAGPGSNAGHLGSLDLLNFIIMTEERFQNEFGMPLALDPDSLVTEDSNPFRTIGTLAEHLTRIVR